MTMEYLSTLRMTTYRSINCLIWSKAKRTNKTLLIYFVNYLKTALKFEKGKENKSNKHVLVRGVSKDAVKAPKITKKVVDFKGNTAFEIHELVPETGYVCLGDVLIKKSDIRKFDKTKYCCVRKDLTVTATENKLGDYKFPVRDRHDTQGLVGGHFLSAKKDRPVRLLRVDNINVQPSFDMRGPRDRPIKV